MPGIKAEVETNLISQTTFCNKLLVNLFISYSTVQEKLWLSNIQIFTAKGCYDFLGKLLGCEKNSTV